MSAANQALRIEAAAAGDPIEAVQVLGSEWQYERAPHEGEVLAWADARLIFDRTFDEGGWEGPKALNFYAWTVRRVIFCHEYDSSTSIAWLPRNPPARPVSLDSGDDA